MNDVAAKSDVEAALLSLRQAMARWRKATGQPATFIFDKRAPPLPPDALTGCRVFANRHDMVQALVHGGEVGVQHGNFSRFLLDQVKPETLHLFDMTFHQLRADVRSDPRATLHAGDSSAQLLDQPDQSFDWLYIDGDHSYKGVVRDADAALKKIRPGGVLIFNDYTPWSAVEAIPYGVMACVNELVNGGLPMIGVALTANGYFDVALRMTEA